MLAAKCYSRIAVLGQFLPATYPIYMCVIVTEVTVLDRIGGRSNR
jgi:hypothetical protein